MLETTIHGKGGAELNVLDWSGDGRSVLLIHGLASNARTWIGVARHLQSLGYRAVSVDLRGHGQSAKPETGYDYDTLVADLIALIDQTSLGRPLVVGQSFGGNLAVELGIRSPDRITGVVGVDGGTIDLPARFDSFEDCWQVLAPPDFADVTRQQIGAYIRSAHPDWPSEGVGATLDNFERLDDGRIRPHLSRDRHRSILQTMWISPPRPADLTVPMLLIPAVDGDMTPEPPAAGIRIAPLRGDHDLHVQQPANVAAVVHSAVDEGFFG